MRLALISLFLLIGSVFARSGSFTLVSGYPTGGTKTTGAPPPPSGPPNNDTMLTDPAWAGYYGGNGTGSPCNCQGKITYKWTWTGGGTAPAAVTIKVDSVASWSYPAGGGSCNNGLGQGITGIANTYSGANLVGQTQTGIGWVQKKVDTTGGVSTVTYDITPSSGAPGGTCSVAVKPTIYLASLTLLGPVDQSGTDMLAVGQLLTATVERSNFPSDPGDKYTWSKPSGGAAFAGYDPTLSSDQFTAFTAPSNFTTTSISCYFAKPASTATVNCVFHSGALGIDITLAGPVKIAAPARSGHGEACGLMTLYPATSPTTYFLFGKNYTSWDPVTQQLMSTDTGMYAYDNLTDPSPLSGGTFAYLQLVDVANTTNGITKFGNGLDGGFPYTTTFNANTTHAGYMDDLPGGPVSATPNFSYAKNGTYTTHLMYKPTASAAGSSVYVPIYKLVWTAVGSCSYSGTSWSSMDGGSQITTSASDFNFPDDYFPTWSSVVHSS